MTNVLRIILAIATLLTVLGLVVGTVWSFVDKLPPLLGITCGLLAVGFSFFVKNDYQYFFGKKS